MANDLYDEWATGVSLAQGNEFFAELPTELEHPGEFSVPTEIIPENPIAAQPTTEVPIPSEPQVVPPVSLEDDSEIIELESGGRVIIEKTGRGWKASLESAEPSVPIENFYGNNKTQLIANLAKGKLEASKAIRKLKRDKLLGGDEHVSAATQAVNKTPTPKVQTLTADDVYEIKNKLQENPAEAFDAWLEKRFGLKPDEVAEAFKAAPKAERMLQAQENAGYITEVNTEFVKNNPDWSEQYADDPSNIRLLIGRMSKAYLNKKITKNTAQIIVDETIYDLYTRGFWTVENLETAKEELIESGLLERSESHRPTPKPKPQPAATEQSSPSVPVTPRIAATTGQPVGFGLPARASAPVSVSEEKPPSDVDLQSMPLSELRAIAAAQLKLQQQGRQ